MKTTEILMQEHQVILKVLNRIYLLLADDLKQKADELKFYFDFIQEYSDKFHHGKEENIYFKWISDNNEQLKAGPVHCMLKEHDHFRELTQSSKSHLLAFLQNENEDDRQICITLLDRFINELRSHIEKEDKVLYQMAEKLNEKLSSGDIEMLPLFENVNSDLAWVSEKYKDLL